MTLTKEKLLFIPKAYRVLNDPNSNYKECFHEFDDNGYLKFMLIKDNAYFGKYAFFCGSEFMFNVSDDLVKYLYDEMFNSKETV